MLRFAWLLVGVLMTACSATSSAGDAGMDAAVDVAPPLDTSRDTGRCEMECPAGRTCCVGPAGVPQCVDLANDIANCGICGRDCVGTRRGDGCAHNQCTCGDFDIGCTGAENSICCPSLAGARPYCANPGLDLTDCGMCGRACDRAQANQCSGGLCLCGDSGGRCAGTPDDLCCPDPAGAFGCVDTRTDQAHCGACGRRCTAFERCVAGGCVPRGPDTGVRDAG